MSELYLGRVPPAGKRYSCYCCYFLLLILHTEINTEWSVRKNHNNLTREEVSFRISGFIITSSHSFLIYIIDGILFLYCFLTRIAVLLALLLTVLLNFTLWSDANRVFVQCWKSRCTIAAILINTSRNGIKKLIKRDLKFHHHMTLYLFVSSVFESKMWGTKFVCLTLCGSSLLQVDFGALLVLVI